MFTVKDLCARYGVAAHTVLNWIASGELRAINIGRKLSAKKPRWRITKESLERFETTRATAPPPTPARSRKRSSRVIEFYR